MFRVVERLHTHVCGSPYRLGCAIFYAASAGNVDFPASYHRDANIHFHRITNPVTRGQHTHLDINTGSHQPCVLHRPAGSCGDRIVQILHAQ